MKNFHLSCVLASILSIVLVACGEKVVEVASVSISQPSAEMEIGETLSLKATVSPSNASYDAITWTSAKPQVASVSASGLVSAISEGNTTITVTAGGKAASCSVTVVKGFVAVSAISLNKTSLELVEDDTETLTATVSPDDATDKTVSWTSSNEAVAKVKDGTITAIKEGNADITAKAGDKTATCSVSVRPKHVAVTGVGISQSNLKMEIGETQTLTITILPSNATDKSVSWKSSNTSVATVSSSGEVTAKSAGSATITVTTKDGGKTATCSLEVVEDVPVLQAVDLGLSVKWASYNLGASRPEGNGGYYAWGETAPKRFYDWAEYKWCNGSEKSLTKYNTSKSNGTVDDKTDLDPEDDAAHVNWGDGWRIPTDAEWTEMRDNCTWTWTTQNGVKGYQVTGKKAGYTDKSIFLPAAGCKTDTYLYEEGQCGFYWSSSLDKDHPVYAWGVYFNIDYSTRNEFLYRYRGCSIRPVCK